MTTAATRRTVTPTGGAKAAPATRRRWGGLIALLLVLPLLVVAAMLVAPRLTRDNQTALAMEAANSLYAAGDYSLAAQAYGQLIEQGADAPAVYYNLGLAATETGEPSRAVEALQAARSLAPREEAITRALARAEGMLALQAAAGDPLLTSASAIDAATNAGVQAELVWWRALSGNEIALIALMAWTLFATLIIVAVRRPHARLMALAGAGVAAVLLLAAGGALVL